MVDASQEDAQESADLFDTLRPGGFNGRYAHYIIKSIEDIAAANLIARFESKLDSVTDALYEREKSQTRQHTTLLIVIAAATIILATIEILQ
ncbi:MAG: hypothetical protein OXM02_00605 [Bacteroidota bacterium]|nr:hypothetical protein [Bacteroidota bacterium]